jgi:hypothetical protein
VIAVSTATKRPSHEAAPFIFGQSGAAKMALSWPVDPRYLPPHGRRRPLAGGLRPAMSLPCRVCDRHRRQRGPKLYSLHAPALERIGRAKRNASTRLGSRPPPRTSRDTLLRMACFAEPHIPIYPGYNTFRTEYGPAFIVKTVKTHTLQTVWTMMPKRLPEQPLTLFTNGRFNHMPLMNGNTTDETNFGLAITEYFSNTNNALRTPPSAEQYLDYVQTTYAPPAYPVGTATRVLSVYPLWAFKSPQSAWDRVGTDSGICNQRRLDKILAPQIPVYAYEFADKRAPFYFPDMPGMEALAYHTADIQYLFPLWHGGPLGIPHPLNPQQTILSDQLVSAWANFAKTGNPNGSGNHPWPRYTATTEAPAWLIQDVPGLSTSTDAEYSALRHCDFWDSATATQ